MSSAGRSAGGEERKAGERELTFFQSKSGEGGTTCGAMADVILSAESQVAQRGGGGAETLNGRSIMTAKLTRGRRVECGQSGRERGLHCSSGQCFIQSNFSTLV